MSSYERVLQSLTFVLVEKLYPSDPRLMRDDSGAALLVFQYVTSMLLVYERSSKIPKGRSKYEDEAHAMYFSIYPLERLQVSTIRKYIARLLLDGTLSRYFELKKVKNI